MDLLPDDRNTLTSLLNSLSLPITITPQNDPTRNIISYTWQWYRYNGSKPLFKDALNDALTQTMNTVIQYAPPGK